MNFKTGKTSFLTFFLLVSLLCSYPALSAQSKSPFPQETKRILFLGNSITYDGRYITDIEAYFITHYPDYQYEFINAGLSSETVSGLSEPGYGGGKLVRPDLHTRLKQVLEQTKPDVVFACYGMNDGIYLPLDDDRFNKYKEGMTKLYNTLKKSGVKSIYIMTPPVHVDKEMGLNGYNLVLDKYSEWLLSQREAAKWEVIDLHFPMKRYIEEKRETNPKFKLADDGIHPGELGHWMMAKEILLYLGEEVSEEQNIESVLKDNGNGNEILKLISTRQAFMKNAWLTAAGHQHPGIPQGLELSQAHLLYDQLENRIRNLQNGVPVAERIHISCVGNSITQGVGVKHQKVESYPAQLQFMLGYDYEVMNFGNSGKTLMDTENAYTVTKQYKEALRSNPDIVTIKLGTNDSRMPFREMIADSFVVQCKRMVQTFKNLPSKPRVILILPVTSFLTEENRQTDKVITEDILPRLRQVADEEGVELVDMHTITQDKASLFPDKLHPNKEGMNLIARQLYEFIRNEN